LLIIIRIIIEIYIICVIISDYCTVKVTIKIYFKYFREIFIFRKFCEQLAITLNQQSTSAAMRTSHNFTYYMLHDFVISFFPITFESLRVSTRM